MSNFYKEFAFIYDRLMIDVDYPQWARFIASKLPSGCHNLLEAACGTGNITSILADGNYNITAFDISEEMLVEAYSKLRRNRNVRILNMDMAKLSVEGVFQGCICCCDGLNYIDESKVKEFFRRVKKHLDTDGVFIFDISTEYKYYSMEKTYVYDDDKVFYVWENSFGEDSTLTMEINFFVEENGLYKRITEEQKHYIHSVKRIVEMLEDAGFHSVEIYDGYTDNELKDLSLTDKIQRGVFVCK